MRKDAQPEAVVDRVSLAVPPPTGCAREQLNNPRDGEQDSPHGHC